MALITCALLVLAAGVRPKVQDSVPDTATGQVESASQDWSSEAVALVAALTIRHMHCMDDPGQACEVHGHQLNALEAWAAKNPGWRRLLSSLALYEVGRRLWQERDYERALAAVEQALAFKLSPYSDPVMADRWQQGLVRPGVMKLSKLEVVDLLLLKSHCLYELGVQHRSVEYLHQAMDHIYQAASLVHSCQVASPEVMAQLSLLFRRLSEAVADVMNGYDDAKLIETLGVFGLECSHCHHRVLLITELAVRLSLPVVFKDMVAGPGPAMCELGSLLPDPAAFNALAYTRQTNEGLEQFLARVFIQLAGSVHLRFWPGLDLVCQYVTDSGVCVYYLPNWVHSDSPFMRGGNTCEAAPIRVKPHGAPRAAQLLLSELQELSAADVPAGGSWPQPFVFTRDGSSTSRRGARSVRRLAAGAVPRVGYLLSLASKHSPGGSGHDAADKQRLLDCVSGMVGQVYPLLDSLLAEAAFPLEAARPPPRRLPPPLAPTVVGGWWGSPGGPGCATQTGGPCRHQASELRRKITLCISAPAEMAGDTNHCEHLSRLGVREVPRLLPPYVSHVATDTPQPCWPPPPFFPPAPRSRKMVPSYRRRYSDRCANSAAQAPELLYDANAGFTSARSGPGSTTADPGGTPAPPKRAPPFGGGYISADDARHVSDLQLQEELNRRAALSPGGLGGTQVRDGPLVIAALACASLGALVSVAGGFKHRRRVTRSVKTGLRLFFGLRCSTGGGSVGSSNSSSGCSSSASSASTPHPPDAQRRRALTAALRDAMWVGGTAARLEAAIAAGEEAVEAPVLQRARALAAQRRREERAAFASGAARSDKQGLQVSSRQSPRDTPRSQQSLRSGGSSSSAGSSFTVRSSKQCHSSPSAPMLFDRDAVDVSRMSGRGRSNGPSDPGTNDRLLRRAISGGARSSEAVDAGQRDGGHQEAVQRDQQRLLPTASWLGAMLSGRRRSACNTRDASSPTPAPEVAAAHHKLFRFLSLSCRDSCSADADTVTAGNSAEGCLAEGSEVCTAPLSASQAGTGSLGGGLVQDGPDVVAITDSSAADVKSALVSAARHTAPLVLASAWAASHISAPAGAAATRSRRNSVLQCVSEGAVYADGGDGAEASEEVAWSATVPGAPCPPDSNSTDDTSAILEHVEQGSEFGAEVELWLQRQEEAFRAGHELVERDTAWQVRGKRRGKGVASASQPAAVATRDAPATHAHKVARAPSASLTVRTIVAQPDIQAVSQAAEAPAAAVAPAAASPSGTPLRVASLSSASSWLTKWFASSEREEAVAVSPPAAMPPTPSAVPVTLPETAKRHIGSSNGERITAPMTPPVAQLRALNARKPTQADNALGVLGGTQPLEVLAETHACSLFLKSPPLSQRHQSQGSLDETGGGGGGDSPACRDGAGAGMSCAQYATVECTRVSDSSSTGSVPPVLTPLPSGAVIAALQRELLTPTVLQFAASLPSPATAAEGPGAGSGSSAVGGTADLGAGALDHLIHRRRLVESPIPPPPPSKGTLRTERSRAKKALATANVATNSQLNPAAAPFPAPMAHRAVHAASAVPAPSSVCSSEGGGDALFCPSSADDRTALPLLPPSLTPYDGAAALQAPPSPTASSSLASLSSTLSQSPLPYSTLFSGGSSLWSPFGAPGGADSSAASWSLFRRQMSASNNNNDGSTGCPSSSDQLFGWGGITVGRDSFGRTSGLGGSDWAAGISHPAADWGTAHSAGPHLQDLALPLCFQTDNAEDMPESSPNYTSLEEVDWAQEILRNAVD